MCLPTVVTTAYIVVKTRIALISTVFLDFYIKRNKLNPNSSITCNYSRWQHILVFTLSFTNHTYFFSDKSKRRTKTVKKVLEPKWNQTFVYSHVHRRDFRERMLEITVWDQPRVQEEESEFLGEVMYTVKIQVKCLFKFL